MILRSLSIVFCVLILANHGFGQNVGSYGRAPITGDRGPSSPEGIDYVQNLGQTVPLDTVLYDHTAKAVSLRDAANGKPMILVMAYSRCPRLCSEVLTNLLDAMKEIRKQDTKYVAGDSFQLVVVSVDPKDSPLGMIAPRRSAFTMEYAGTIDHPGVTFLTASQGQGTDVVDAEAKIYGLAQVVGFGYQLFAKGKNHKYDPEGRRWLADDGKVLADPGRNYDYQHPPGIVFVSPNGVITRYLTGLNYRSIDVRIALVEASSGTIGSLADKAAFYCFAYDKVSGHYKPVMRILAMIAAPFVLLVGFITYRAVRTARSEPKNVPAALLTSSNHSAS